MSYFLSPNICPECKCKLYMDKKHECVIMVNGLPREGKNHMKMDFEINEVDVTVIESELFPNEENAKLIREHGKITPPNY